MDDGEFHILIKMIINKYVLQKLYNTTSSYQQQTTSMTLTYLQAISFLQLIRILILAILTLLALDAGVHPLLLHLRPRQVEVSICLCEVLMRLQSHGSAHKSAYKLRSQVL